MQRLHLSVEQGIDLFPEPLFYSRLAYPPRYTPQHNVLPGERDEGGDRRRDWLGLQRGGGAARRRRGPTFPSNTASGATDGCEREKEGLVVVGCFASRAKSAVGVLREQTYLQMLEMEVW
jgi:hypothetical protein